MRPLLTTARGVFVWLEWRSSLAHGAATCGDWQTTSVSLSEFQFKLLDIDGREDEVKGLLFDAIKFARNN